MTKTERKEEIVKKLMWDIANNEEWIEERLEEGVIHLNTKLLSEYLYGLGWRKKESKKEE